MPEHDNIKKLLVIGAGPVRIGQGRECDAMGAIAVRELKRLGFSVVVVDPNPTGMMTAPALADTVYIEPLNVKILTEIISVETPDALLPMAGGRTGFQSILALEQNGVLDTYGVALLGASAQLLACMADRTALTRRMAAHGVPMPESRRILTVEQALETAEALGYPVAIRPLDPLSDHRPWVHLAYNTEELRHRISGERFSGPVIPMVLEATALGKTELEVEIMRDTAGGVAVAGWIENIDPVGVHAGDSIAVVPPRGIGTDRLHHLAETAAKMMEALDFTGLAGVRFAVDPDGDEALVLGFRPYFSGASALVSAATGCPLARHAAMIAAGKTVDDINPRTPLQASEAPVSVVLPRWDFHRYDGAEDRLGTCMRSVGHAMGTGESVAAALVTAVHAAAPGASVFRRDTIPGAAPKHRLAVPDSRRLFRIMQAFREGESVATVAETTGIRPWFLESLKSLSDIEQSLAAAPGTPPGEALLKTAKAAGISDADIARLRNLPLESVAEKRRTVSRDAWSTIGPDSNLHYGIHTDQEPARPPAEKTILILGSGANRIGHGCAPNYAVDAATDAFHDAGYRVVLVHSAPDSVAAFSERCDAVYAAPMTAEAVLSIIDHEAPEGVVVQFGGEDAIALTESLASAGVPLLGNAARTAPLSMDRLLFRDRMRGLGIPQPKGRRADSPETVSDALDEIGYPAALTSLGGTLQHLLTEPEDLARWRSDPGEGPWLVESFLEKGEKIEVDALTDGADAWTPVIVEHIEPAGVHAGDSAFVVPPIGISPRHLETIREYTVRIAAEIGAVGLLHLNFAIQDDSIYILEASPKAGGTLPIVAKLTDTPMTAHAVRLMLGASLADLNPAPVHLPFYGAREAVFPYDRFPEVDPILGPVMRAAGEVCGISQSFGRAFFKSQEAALAALPLEGDLLITVADRDKPAILEAARRFRDLGFGILATRGTLHFLEENGISARPIRKLGYGRPDIVDVIKTRQIDLVINTPGGKKSQTDDAYIRKAAIRFALPYITSAAAAEAAARGIQARRKGRPRVQSLQNLYSGIGRG